MMLWTRHTICFKTVDFYGFRGAQRQPVSSIVYGSRANHTNVQRRLVVICRPSISSLSAASHFIKRWPRRTLFLESIPTFLLPPVAFIGLFISLWTYKCMMMVLFQDKIIYMPYVPPFSRSEKVDDYVNQCKPVLWKTTLLKSSDSTKIALCVGTIRSLELQHEVETRRHVVICYFQGNGSSLPPRLPILSNVLKLIAASQNTSTCPNTRYTIVALSYRGYWTSSGRASQSGIELDAAAVLKWLEKEFSADDLEIVMWGQSIGAGVATTAAASYGLQDNSDKNIRISALVLETPFSSIRSMLSAMYPQKWLPYGYLWPFLWNHWDSEQALKRIAQQSLQPKVLLMVAKRDEIVPPSEADKLERLCDEVGLKVQRADIPGALHTEATSKRGGQAVVAKFVIDMATSSLPAQA